MSNCYIGKLIAPSHSRPKRRSAHPNGIDEAFFTEGSGRKRVIRGAVIDPDVEPLPKVFAKNTLVRVKEAALTVTDCWQHYYDFCRSKGLNPVERKEFKRVVTEVIKEKFDLKIRHDVPGSNGKEQVGWIGVELRLGDQLDEVFSKN